MNYLKIIRPINLFFITVVLCVMSKVVLRNIMLHYQLSDPIAWWMLLLLVLATVLIAAGGYVINDYFDVKIDAINRPDRLIVTRAVSKQHAMLLFQCLTGVGIACGVALAIVLRSMTLGVLFFIVPGILWFYSASYKRQFLIGNLIIALLAALVPLLVALVADTVIKHEFGQDSMLGQYLINLIYLYLSGFALFAFLTTWAREIIKDIEDQEGDREMECHTLPVMYGNLASKIVVTVILVSVMALLIVANIYWLKGGFDIASAATKYILVIELCFVITLVLLWRARLPQDFHNTQTALKLTMLLGTLLAFVL